MIFDETTLRKLNRLTLIASRVRAGVIKGGRRSSRRGSSVEFADYRDYAPGDDLRRLDWNIYARLERPFIKLLEEEEDLAVHLLLDASRSMDWGEAEANKFDYARHLAAGLGAIALASGDVITVGCLQNGHVTREYGPARGQGVLPRLFQFLEGLQADGETDLNGSLQEYARGSRRAGLVILISDLLAADGQQSGLRHLLSHNHEAVLIHLLSPQELDPQLQGDLQLVDVETGQSRDVSIDGRLAELYRTRIREWIRMTGLECHQHGIRYLGLTSAQPWDQALLLEMRRNGIVK